jgi:hypothetical protein
MSSRLTKLLEHHMATISDQLNTLIQLQQQTLAAVQGLSPAKPDDLTPVTTAIASVQTTLSAVQTQVGAIAAKLPIDQQTTS